MPASAETQLPNALQKRQQTCSPPMDVKASCRRHASSSIPAALYLPSVSGGVLFTGTDTLYTYCAVCQEPSEKPLQYCMPLCSWHKHHLWL